MINQSYDEKNQQDFDANTDLIHEALDKIASRSSLKPTITQLSKITGLHRNTLRDRQWPIEKINDIKEERKLRSMLRRREKKNQIRELESQLEKACKEIALWFTKFKKKELEYNSLEAQSDRLREAREFYEAALRRERDKVKDREEQLIKMHELLKDLK